MCFIIDLNTIKTIPIIQILSINLFSHKENCHWKYEKIRHGKQLSSKNKTISLGRSCF